MFKLNHTVMTISIKQVAFHTVTFLLICITAF